MYMADVERFTIVIHTTEVTVEAEVCISRHHFKIKSGMTFKSSLPIPAKGENS